MPAATTQDPHRHHSFTDALRTFRSMYSGIGFVVDVGVQAKTQPLLDVYGDVLHLLYEPAVAFRAEIARNYAETRHELRPVAVSSTPGRLFQHMLSKDTSGAVTHSFLRSDDVPDPSLRDLYIGIEPIDVVTLDEELSGQKRFAPLNTLLKIDVDGLDSEVLLGARSFSGNVALLAIEATVERVGERIRIAHDLGFELWDMTSPAYYFEQLSQVDLFFVNARLKADDLSFRPWEKTNWAVDWEHWRHLD